MKATGKETVAQTYSAPTPNQGACSTPFDTTPYRRPLVGVHRPPDEHSIDRRPDIGCCHREVVSRAGIVELTPIDKPTFAIEDERIRRTGRGKGASHVLGLVEEIRKRPAVVIGLQDHLIGSVLRVSNHVIAGYTDHRGTLLGKVPTECGESGRDVLDVWAMVTEKRDDKRWTRELVKADHSAGRRLEQHKRGCWSAEGEHGGLDGHIRQSSPHNAGLPPKLLFGTVTGKEAEAIQTRLTRMYTAHLELEKASCSWIPSSLTWLATFGGLVSHHSVSEIACLVKKLAHMVVPELEGHQPC